MYARYGQIVTFGHVVVMTVSRAEKRPNRCSNVIFGASTAVRVCAQYQKEKILHHCVTLFQTETA